MSELVKKMNVHIGTALSLMKNGCASNNEKIRDEIKEFFSVAEKIYQIIAENEVSSINNVKYNELVEIKRQNQKLREFLEMFDNKILEIERNIRATYKNTSQLLNC